MVGSWATESVGTRAAQHQVAYPSSLSRERQLVHATATLLAASCCDYAVVWRSIAIRGLFGLILGVVLCWISVPDARFGLIGPHQWYVELPVRNFRISRTPSRELNRGPLDQEDFCDPML